MNICPEIKRIVFLLPQNRVSGGLFIVYQHATFLVNSGYDIWLAFECYNPDEELPSLDKRIRIVTFEAAERSPRQFDLAIATWWETVFSLPRVDARSYAYFVQSDERNFYQEMDSHKRRACSLTYSLPGLNYITIAKWLTEMLRNEFSRSQVYYAPNGIDLSVFNKDVVPLDSTRPSQGVRVLIEGPGSVDFKRVDFAFRVCDEVRKFTDLQVWYVSSDGTIKDSWHAERFFSRVPHSDMPAIYRSCDVLLKLSVVEGFFGPPLEMMACGGVALTSDVSGYDEYIQQDRNALVVKRDDFDGAVAALKRICSNKDLREDLVAEGLKTAEIFNWNKQHEYFQRSIVDLLMKPVDEKSREDLRTSIFEVEREYRGVKFGENMSFLTRIKKAIKRSPLLYRILLILMCRMRKLIVLK